MRVEARVDGGQLRMKSMVSGARATDSGRRRGSTGTGFCCPHPAAASTKPPGPAGMHGWLWRQADHRTVPPPLQESLFGDVQLKEQALGCLFAYNPFWLKLGLEVVTQRAVGWEGHPGARGGLRGGGSWADQLHHFALNHFFSDADMVADMEVARGAATFDREGFWVSGGAPRAGGRRRWRSALNA